MRERRPNREHGRGQDLHQSESRVDEPVGSDGDVTPMSGGDGEHRIALLRLVCPSTEGVHTRPIAYKYADTYSTAGTIHH